MWFNAKEGSGVEGKRRLRALVEKQDLIVAPGVYDMLSLKVADSIGFEALYMTGYGVAASHLGLPDAGLATYTDMVDRVRRMAEGTNIPLIADADTGYGGLLNVRHTVRGYEDAGAQGIQIEDQEMPKKCGHTPGRRIVSTEEMVLKIKVALEARRREDTLIIARTDARTSLGLDEALRRAEAYAAAGADIIFVESPESEAELQKIGASIDKPLLANMAQTGRTPVMSAETLKSWGYSIAIYPGLGFLAAAEAIRDSLLHLKSEGSSIGLQAPLYPSGGDDRTIHQLMGFPDVWEFERRWAVNA
ncbi:isocitrate lyase/PEP mutase family protein [Bradyrhizobium sp. INPA03-11B]|uniref:isocitrate lyase/PEP mutase family protein n=1 Tax=Bradyrhizobium sp. INPA03-11B TaxID=418598 RepID=UPI00338EB838